MLDSLDSLRAVVLRASPYTASVLFEVDGQAADPGSVAVTVTRDDGTTVASGFASGSGRDARTYDLTAAHTATLDVLTITWVSAGLGTLTTQVEVVGGFVCALGQIDASLDRGGVAADYNQALKEQARTIATDALEAELHVACTPRYRRERLSPPCGRELLLPTPRVSAVRSVLIDGQALDVDELAAIDVDSETGTLYRSAGWNTQRRGLTIAWEHGYVTPPGDVSRAVALIASSILADGPWDDRGMGVTGDGGMVRLLTAGVGGAAFSIPEVQALVRRRRFPVIA